MEADESSWSRKRSYRAFSFVWFNANHWMDKYDKKLVSNPSKYKKWLNERRNKRNNEGRKWK